MARKYHPEVNHGDKGSAEKFQEINEAHEVLSDPEKREKYDRLGSDWWHHQRSAGKAEDFNWGEWRSDPNQSHTYRTVSPEEFEELFGAGGDTWISSRACSAGVPSGIFPVVKVIGNSTTRRHRDADGDSEDALQVSLNEAFRGTRRVLEWEDGRKIDAKIPRGIKTGSRVRLKGQGVQGIGGGESGDLYLTIEVLPDTRFQRDNDDLSITAPVDLFTMILGGKVSVSGIDRSVKLDIPSETPNGRVFRLRGLGMPKISHPDQRGDLYVTVEAILQQRLTARERELVEQWKNMR